MEIPSALPSGLNFFSQSDDADGVELVGRARLLSRSLRSCWPHVMVICVTAVVFLAITGIAHRTGSSLPTDFQFFAGQQPTDFDAATVIPMEYALHSGEANDVVFFGESACRCGISPDSFERLTRLSSYNLGSCGALGPTGQIATVRAYLDSHPAPRMAVLCMLPTSFEWSTAAEETEQFIRFYGIESEGGMSVGERLKHTTSLGARSVLGRLGEVRDLPVYGLGDSYWGIQAKLSRSRGFSQMPSQHGPLRSLPRTGESVLIRDDWDAAIRLVAARCERSGVLLLIRFAPLSSDVSSTEDFSPLDRWAGELEGSYPSVRVARPIVLAYEPRFMWDNIHLNAAGVAKFMPLVAADAQAALK